MPKVTDYEVRHDVSDIMEKYVEKFPSVFDGFDVDKVFCVHSLGKKNKKPLKVRSVGYPYDTLISKTYIIEVADESWKEMDQKRKNLSVFHGMCSIPSGGFDEESKFYAKIRKPDYELFEEEYAITGGVPNWMENDSASDPMDDDIERVPVTQDAIEEI